MLKPKGRSRLDGGGGEADRRLLVGTWNVRTMNMVGKLEEVKREMKRYGLNILGVSEVRWKGQGDFNSDGMRVIYSGGDQCKQGVALILDEEVGRRVIEVNQVSDRLVMIKINANLLMWC